MILVTITNPRYKLFMLLLGVLVIVFAFWAINAGQGEPVSNSTPAINSLQESPKTDSKIDIEIPREKNLIDSLKNYYQGK